MKQTTVPMKEDARLIIKTSEDVLIEGNDLAQLTAIVDDGDSFRMKDEGGVIYIRANSNSRLRIPAGATVTLERVGGDAGLLNFHGRVVIQKVGGDLSVQNVSGFTGDSVGGDCVLKDITAAVELNRVGGDVDGFNVDQFRANNIGGDLELTNGHGKVQTNVGGDVRLQFNSPEIAETHVKAGGDIYLSVVENAKALLQLSSGGEEISVEACGQHLDSKTGSAAIPLGEGGAMVELIAGDKIKVREGKESMGEFSFVFKDIEDNWRDFGKEIEEKIRESMKGVNHSLRQAGWQASDAVRRATEQVNETMRRRDGKVYGFSFDDRAEEPVKKEKKAVSDDERMLVLKMLQEKKISVEEAEKLLQSLER